MRVLAHVHTYNDADVIQGTLAALRAQTLPIAGILLVDNASTDGTLDRVPSDVTVIRHDENLGTSGAVHTGFRYALERDYDWVWVLDADTEPLPDALARLFEFYATLSAEERARTRMLSSMPRDAQSGALHHGINFTARGLEEVQPEPDVQAYPCDSNMWTGSLFRAEAIRKIGLPNPNYVLDWGDIEYGYQGTVQGYQGYMVLTSTVLHNLHPNETLRRYRFGRRDVKMFESPPIRFYYVFRNTVYFWLYEYDRRSFVRIFLPHVFTLAKMLGKSVLLIPGSLPLVGAAARGFWDGIRGRLDERF